MKQIIERVDSIIKLQRLSWYFFFAYFVVATVVSFIDNSIADKMAYAGIIALLVVTFLKALVMGLVFQREDKRFFSFMSYALTVVLLATILLKLWI